MKSTVNWLNCQHSDHAHRKTVIVDAGFASEENLELIRVKGYECLCVSRKRLKNFSLKDRLVTQETLQSSVR